MGDRISISFRKRDEESTWLYSHWGGFRFAQSALDHAKNIVNNRKNAYAMPLSRLEPDTVLVDFIRAYTRNMDVVESDLYLPYPVDRGDDSDNGHFVIDLEKMELCK